MTEEQRRLTLPCHLLVWIYLLRVHRLCELPRTRSRTERLTAQWYCVLARVFSQPRFLQLEQDATLGNSLQGVEEPPDLYGRTCLRPVVTVRVDINK